MEQPVLETISKHVKENSQQKESAQIHHAQITTDKLDNLL